MASVNSFETDMKKLRRKRKRKRAAKNTMVIFAVLALVLVIYLTNGYWLPYFEGILDRGISSIENGEIEESENYPIDISKRINVDIHTMNDCWTLYSDTSLQTRGFDGSVINTYYMPYSSPIVEAASKRILVYDMGGYSFSVVGKKSEVFSKKLTNQILFCELGESGNVAVVTSTEKYPSYLTIYDKNGTEIYRWADGNLITSVTLDSSGSGCVVASAYALGGSIKTIVTALDFSKTDIVSKSAPLEAMVLDLEYTKKGGIWVVGDTAVYRLDSSCALDYTFSFNYDLDMFAAEDDIAVLTFDKAGTKDTILVVLDASNSTSSEKTYSEDIKHIDISDGIVYYNTKSSLCTMDKSGNSLGDFDLSAEYVSFAVGSDSILMQGYYSIDKLSFGDKD